MLWCCRMQTRTQQWPRSQELPLGQLASGESSEYVMERSHMLISLGTECE